MEDISHRYFEVTPEEIETIRKTYDIADTKIRQEKLNAVKDWCEKQDHLAEAYQYINCSVLERLLLLAKGSVEITKNKVDKLFTTRGMIPELVLNRTCNDFEKILKNVVVFPLKKLNPSNQARIAMIRCGHDFFDEISILELLRYSAMIGDFRLFFDYSVADVYIYDMKDVHINFLTHMNPILLKKSEILGSEAYSYKVKGIYILNAPPFVDRFLSIISSFMKEKVANRMHVISSYEDLYKDIPKKVLPKDLGGDEPSIAELYEQWKGFLRSEEGTKQIEICNKLVSDESKRSCIKFNEEYLGMPGTFRQLTVD